MRLRTEIEPMLSQQPIGCRDSIFVIGSCFAENIGGWLRDNYLDVYLNPFGVLYNPSSIASSLLFLLNNKTFSRDEMVQGKDGMFYSFAHHGKFSAKSADELTEILNKNKDIARDKLFKSKHILVTFGTAWVFERGGEVVANCHKFHTNEFLRRRLSVEEIVGTWRSLIERLIGEGSSQATGNTHFIFTVSPIRHVKDGLHGNQLSKATLLLAIDELCRLFPKHVEYLPAYELLVDDLRDYRFYAEDMVHPNTTAVEFVKEYFAKSCLDEECRCFLKEAESLSKALQHKPLHPESPAFRQFIEDTNQRLLALEDKYKITIRQ